MRYQIISTRSDVPQQTASSRERADAIFTSIKEAAHEGETVELIDTRKPNAEKGTTYTVLNRYRRETKEERKAWTDSRLTSHVERELGARGAIMQFTADVTANLDTDPTYYFRWADSAFEAAARYHVALIVKKLREREQSWKVIAENLQAEVLRMSRSPSRSTSTSANLAAQCLQKAYADMLEYLQSWDAEAE